MVRPVCSYSIRDVFGYVNSRTIVYVSHTRGMPMPIPIRHLAVCRRLHVVRDGEGGRGVCVVRGQRSTSRNSRDEIDVTSSEQDGVVAAAPAKEEEEEEKKEDEQVEEDVVPGGTGRNPHVHRRIIGFLCPIGFMCHRRIIGFMMQPSSVFCGTGGSSVRLVRVLRRGHPRSVLT